jgi:hypothetical protein
LPATIWTFDVRSWSGDIHVDDSDGVVVDGAFVEAAEATERLARTEWLALAAAYLRGAAPPGSFFAERWHAEGGARSRESRYSVNVCSPSRR